MANKFQITISAVDKATKVVRGVKNSFSKIVRPISNIGKSVSNLGKETGISKMIGNFAKLGKSGAEVGSKLGVMAGPMAAIGGATSIAGIATLASEWGRLGVETANAAANIGIGTEKLATMQGVAKLAGTSSEGLTRGLKSMGDTMQDALYGRNQQALVLMSRLGIGIHRTASGAVDAERAFSDLADAIARQSNPQTQSLIARQFGLEDQLPLLRKGSAGIAEYKRRVQELNPVTEQQMDAAAKFGQSQNLLGVAITGVGNSIEQRLIPKFQPMIEGLTNWIKMNRDASANIAEVGVSLAIVGGIAAAVAIPFGLTFALFAGVAAAAVAAVALIYTHWDGISGFFQDKWNTVKGAFDKGFLQGVVKVIREFNPILLMADIMNGLVKWLFDFDLKAAGIHVMQGMVDGISGFFRDKRTAVKNSFDKGFIQGIVEAIKQFNPISLMADIMNGLVKWLFDFDLSAAGIHVISNLVQGMKSVLPAGLVHTLGLDVTAAPGAAGSASAVPLPLTMPNAGGSSAAQPQTVHVVIDGKNMPQGTHVKATSGMGNYLPTRVNYSMPTMVAG